MDYDKWTSIGECMGLKESDLQDYVEMKESDYFDREERRL